MTMPYYAVIFQGKEALMGLGACSTAEEKNPSLLPVWPQLISAM